MGRMSKTDTVAETEKTVSTAAPKVAGSQTATVGSATPDPMHLWNRLKRTDPKATKPFTRSGGFRGTQIDPTWRLMMMTEVFGPVGKGWGYEQMDWTIAERMIFICARVWYLDPETGEKCWTGPQWGGTEMVRRRNGIEAPDDECFKMSMTDAVGKCLVQLGLAADVHMGQFDDSKYREEAEAFYAAKSNPDLQPAAIAAFEEEIRKRLGACLDLDDLEELWRTGAGTRLREIGTVDRTAQHRITSLFAQKKAEILKQDDDEGGDLEAA
ncbi:hypothetical protein FBZ84_102149 [Azospirillum baldaniorum]|nr:hypothetical protein FBZ84_102149 [Azospirillum baldaniorum]